VRCISEAAVRHGQTAAKLCSGFAKQEEQLSSMATRQAVHQAMYNYKTSCPPGMEQLQGAMLQDTPDTNSLVAFASAVANKMLVTICLVSLACVGHLKLVKPQGPYLVSLRVVFSGWNDSLLLLRGASWQAKEVLHQARPPVQGPLGQLPTHGLLHCVLDDLVYVIMHHSAGRDTVRHTQSARIQCYGRRSAVTTVPRKLILSTCRIHAAQCNLQNNTMNPKQAGALKKIQ